ncbi:addiction module antidote protein [Dyella acidiphila]|uniref:Addiction module antidote protein n=1 Tax=Dyella acidiphila TaxID=2775866 RepID=A0ABR9GDW3_9GAMM|nr:addiction module antidote protein [Dyella acidiphila]MBE1162217.1 putative addiction module antidote protein [Dyella acidiphila]
MAIRKKETFTRYDTADYLKSEEDITAYLDVCFEENDPALMATALGHVARARNMSQIARDTGLTREGLYKALCMDGNPTLATAMKVANALGYQLRLVPLPH